MIAVGSIYYLQDRGFFHDRSGGRGVCRNPWIVEGSLNGICAAARRNHHTGHWEYVIRSGRSDGLIAPLGVHGKMDRKFFRHGLDALDSPRRRLGRVLCGLVIDVARQSDNAGVG